MDQFFKTEKELLQGIIDKDGDCIDASWCIMCPFSDACAFKAVRDAKLLPKEERVKRAFDKLFTELVDEELDD
jgi:hypothetical protein